MAQSIRKRQREALVQQLKTITKANGYNFDVALVTSKLLRHEQLLDWPAISVVTGIVRKVVSDNSASLWQVNTTYAVIGYVKEDGETLADAADNLLEDIEECLLAGWQAGTLDEESKLLLLEAEEPYLDFENNYAEVAVVVVMQHYHEANV
jgi:uncharacterized protein YecE (DUF72 family)